MATFTDSNLSSGFNQTTLGNAIITAFTNAGFSTPIQDYLDVSNNRQIIWQVVANSLKTYGTFFIKVQITTALAVTQTLSTGWNTTTKVATNASSANTSVTYNNTIAVQFKSINGGNEFKLPYIYQIGTTLSQILGYIYPDDKNSIDENSYCMAFQFTSPSSKTFLSTAQVPFTSTSFPLQDYTNCTDADVNGVFNVFPLMLFNTSGKGIAAICSNNFGVAAMLNFPVFSAIGTYTSLQKLNVGVVVK